MIERLKNFGLVLDIGVWFVDGVEERKKEKR